MLTTIRHAIGNTIRFIANAPTSLRRLADRVDPVTFERVDLPDGRVEFRYSDGSTLTFPHSVFVGEA